MYSRVTAVNTQYHGLAGLGFVDQNVAEVPQNISFLALARPRSVCTLLPQKHHNGPQNDL